MIHVILFYVKAYLVVFHHHIVFHYKLWTRRNYSYINSFLLNGGFHWIKAPIVGMYCLKFHKYVDVQFYSFVIILLCNFVNVILKTFLHFFIYRNFNIFNKKKYYSMSMLPESWSMCARKYLKNNLNNT